VDYPADDPSGPASRAAPTKIGRYTVLDLLGVGGMGVVCTAYDPKLDRKVALKLLRKRPKDDGRNSTGQARLIREAQALAKLNHPNIVTVHDVDKVDGQIYMAMEYVDGMSLDKWMIRGERSWREVVQMFVHAARGLAAAHAAGITHRDFKPANVLIGKDGRVLVVDFGLAKSQDQDERRSVDLAPGSFVPIDPAEMLRERGSLMEVIGSTQDTKLTQVGRTVGTPAYMAPEQFLGMSVGPDTDQFSFGVALFEALYGYLPFPDDDREELVERVTSGRVAEPPKDTPVPGWVHRVVLRALQKRSEERYPNMDALIVALQADPAKRRRRAMGALGAVLLAGMGAYGVAQGIASEGDVCGGASERIEEVWGDGREAEVQAAFEATALPYAPDAWRGVEKEMGRRADAWVEHHVDVCEATNVRREQSSRLMDVRMACLERRRGEMRALVEVFVSPDEDVVLEAVKAVQSLESSAGCLTEMEGAGFGTDDPAQMRKIEEVDRLLARSNAMELSGQAEGAVEVAAKALRSARELGHQPTLARAATRHARLYALRTDQLESARDELIEAIGLATKTNQPALEVVGWATLISLEGVKRGHPEAGLALRVPADIALQQLQDQQLEALLLQAVGSVLHQSDRHDEALAAQLEALEKYRSVYGQEHTMVAAILGNVGVEYGNLGRIEDARRYLEDAAAMLEGLHGPRHPVLGSVRINLGARLQQAGDARAAHAQYLLAEQVFRVALPPGHPRRLKAMLGLAQTELVFDPDRAEERFEEVLAMVRAQKEPNLPVMVASYNSLGRLRRQRGDALSAEGRTDEATRERSRAAESFEAALQTLQRQGEEARSDNQLLVVNANFCFLEQERGDIESAMQLCRAAWDVQIQIDSLHPYGVQSLGALVEMDIEQGNRGRALQLLRSALSETALRDSFDAKLDLADRFWKSSESRAEALSIVQQLAKDAALDDSMNEREIKRWLGEHSL